MRLRTLSFAQTSSQRYAVAKLFQDGGLPAPRLRPLLKGRKCVFALSRDVVIYTRSGSTAKWATQRPKAKNGSRGSRSKQYCRIACSTFCPVSEFLSSAVKRG